MKFNTCGKAIALALTVGASLALAPSSYGFVQEPNKDTAQQEKPKDKPNAGATAQQADTITITGMVTGGEKNVLTVTDDKNAQFKVTVTSDTKLSKAGKAATTADLKPNDKVTVQAKSGTDGALTAMTIDIGGE